ncbi:MAG TPA: zf-HC2 domain-containing protein [Candidatus Saccharimonadales bacterium]|nr:zf-HC2 domain-containing protein [Candidatus Saccharimonadales bacterium]
MNCRSVESLFSSYIEDEISQEERRNVEAHFMGCRRCSLALREVRATMSFLSREVPLAEPSPHFDEDVYARIRSGEGLRPSAWELLRELVPSLRLRPVYLAGAGVSALAVALAFSPMGQGLLRQAPAVMTASHAPASTPGATTVAPVPAPATVVAERNVAPEPRPASPGRAGSVVASAPRTASAVQDSIVDGSAPVQRYNDEIINDQFYLDRGRPGQDPSVVPVNATQDDGVYIIF